MSNNAQRRLREKREMRLKILDAARALFIVGGEEAVTLRGVAEKIEYSATTIYSHFTDKEALLWELCAADFMMFSRLLKQAERTPDPIERLRQISATYVDFGLQYPGYYRLMFMPSTTTAPLNPPVTGTNASLSTPGVNSEDDPLKEGPYRFFYGAVFKAMAAGCFRPEYREVSDIAQVLWSGLHGVVAMHFVRGKYPSIPWRPIQTAKETMIDCLIGGLVK